MHVVRAGPHLTKCKCDETRGEAANGERSTPRQFWHEAKKDKCLGTSYLYIGNL